MYDNLEESVNKVSEYMISGISSENIELTEVSIHDEGMKAKVIPWSTLAESIVKILKS